MSEIELVFAETSPYGSVEAVIEQDDQVAYLYLRGVENSSFQMKSCWIRNFVKAPDELDRNRLSAGLAPTLPAPMCQNPEPGARLDEKQLRIVWFEEGDGAALLENEELLAMIPASTGSEQFDGFARDCKRDSPFCCPLPAEDHQLIMRVAEADQFWKSWQSNHSPWMEAEPKLLSAYSEIWGEPVQYLAIDQGTWPPRTAAVFHHDQRKIVASVGNSVCPQPKVDRVFDQPRAFRRFEWATGFDESISDELIRAFAGYLAAQLPIPWQQQSFFADGHSVGCQLFLQSEEIPDFSSIMLCSQERLDVSYQIKMPEVCGDPVNLLWSIPLFEGERKYIRDTANVSLLDQLIEDEGLPVVRTRSTLI